MDTHFFGFFFKMIGALGLWIICGVMIYKNEMERPRHERIADSSTMMLLSAIWPIWLIGVLIASLYQCLCFMVAYPFRRKKRGSKNVRRSQ